MNSGSDWGQTWCTDRRRHPGNECQLNTESIGCFKGRALSFLDDAVSYHVQCPQQCLPLLLLFLLSYSNNFLLIILMSPSSLTLLLPPPYVLTNMSQPFTKVHHEWSLKHLIINPPPFFSSLLDRGVQHPLSISASPATSWSACCPSLLESGVLILIGVSQLDVSFHLRSGTAVVAQRITACCRCWPFIHGEMKLQRAVIRRSRVALLLSCHSHNFKAS